ncbi:hypothetical protein GCM10009846_28340 [Agrococcus versicolor]|uniref:Cytosolic protein n=1 Tax=Agrococcus versicolor TaxID=501482 RepID=A0ABN3AYL1_9MICO
MSAIDALLHGAIDLHTHSGPSPMPRRLTHVEAARQADEAGFRAILVKCHYHSTVTDVLAMAPELAGIRTQVLGGLALNSVAGGLNVHAVDLALRMGGRLVWFPTISSAAHLAHAREHERTKAHFQPLGMRAQDEVRVTDDHGEVLPVAQEIIAMTRDAGAITSTGHLGAEEATAIVEAAHAAGQRRVLVSHPNYIAGIDHDLARHLASLGAVFEHEIGMYHSGTLFGLDVLLDWIREVGPEHTIIGSDLGQEGNPLPIEGYRRLLPRLLDSGVTERDVRRMIGGNQAVLLGLD